jgi:ATP-dependent protease ClpP protease subunit
MKDYDILMTEKLAETGGFKEKELAHSDSKHRIESYNNDIWFYSEVNRSNNLTLNKKLDMLGTRYINYANSLGVEEVTPIRLHINSYGGSVFAGFSSVDYILNCKVPVYTVINGCAASAATIMSVVGDHRAMHRHSFMLIHQLSSGMWGKFESMKDDLENSTLLMKKIKEIYEKHTKIPKNKLDDILKHDLWWDAETCLQYGLVDEII